MITRALKPPPVVPWNTDPEIRIGGRFCIVPTGKEDDFCSPTRFFRGCVVFGSCEFVAS